MNLDLYRDSLDLFCENQKQKDAQILDIACGPGNITRFILSKNPDYKILGIDLSSKMIELAKTNNPSTRFEVMDCREISILTDKYDGIICGFGLPYLSKEEAIKLIKDVASLIKKGGLFYISTMEGNYADSGWRGPSSGEGPKVYMYYHQWNYLESALQENGFEIIHLKRQEYPENGDQDLIVLAQRKKRKTRRYRDTES